MEIMLLAVVSPEIRCQWRLEDWQVALVSTVRSSPNQGTLFNFQDFSCYSGDVYHLPDIVHYLILTAVFYVFRWCFWVLWSVGFSVVILPTDTDAGRSDVTLDP